MAGNTHLRRPGEEHVRREWDTVGPNSLRIEPAVAAQLVEALNAELSGLYILFNQVRKHWWLAEGAESKRVGSFLEVAADRLSETTDAVAIRVHALGGVPVCGPMGIRQHAPLYIEAPHHYDLRSSLARDLEAYATLAAERRDHIELVESLGDQTTGELLRGHLKTLEEDANTLERLLDDDSLVGADSFD